MVAEVDREGRPAAGIQSISVRWEGAGATLGGDLGKLGDKRQFATGADERMGLPALVPSASYPIAEIRG